LKAKEYLEQLGKMLLTVEEAATDYESYKERAYSVSAVHIDNSKVKGGKRSNKVEVSVAKLTELRQKRDEAVKAYDLLREQLSSEIKSLNNVKHRQLLRKLYIDFKSPKSAASEMGYDYGYIRHIHSWALLDFEQNILAKKL
jgi:hypothetical protein